MIVIEELNFLKKVALKNTIQEIVIIFSQEIELNMKQIVMKQIVMKIIIQLLIYKAIWG